MDPDQDDEPCVICLDGTVYDDNEIIFCEKCGIAVHQSCYGVLVIPEDAWYCDVCKAGKDPNQTDCRLCPNRGGAYKRTEIKDTWAHSLCATWVPDAFIDSSGKQIVYNCSVINKSRFKLKCAVCNKYDGAGIQCAFGRCCVPAHPWCAIRPQSGFTHRIVKSVDNPGSYDWDIFCPQHADAVTDPVKPKVKQKRLPGNDYEEVEAEAPKANNKPKASTPSAAPRGRPKGSTAGSSSSKSRPRARVLDGDSESNSSSGSEEDEKPRGESRFRSSDGDVSTSSRAREASASANIYTVSEWPGQGVGEPLDLQHFWNVVSMLYPEDFSDPALKSVLDPIIKIADEASSLLDIPKRGDMALTMQHLAAGHENLFDPSLGTEKERASATDEERIDQLMWSVANVIGALKSSVGTTGLCSQEGNSSDDVPAGQGDGNDDEHLFIGKQTEGLKVNPTSFDLQPMEYFTIQSSDASVNAQRKGKHPLSVVFEKEDASRIGCEYSICFPANGSACSCCKVHVPLTLKDREGDEKYIINHFSTWINSTDACIIPGRPRTANDLSASEGLVVGVSLKETSSITASSRIPLPNGTILSRDDEDELALVMRRELKAYSQLLETITASVKSIYDNPEFKELIGKRYNEAQEATRLQSQYFEQQVWKNVARSFNSGVKDQRTDFNRPVLDAVPASWTIKVGDREAIIKAAESNPEEDAEEHEDVVCMVCFDGNSTDSNRILFCDGCNSAMHQSCYGIAEIPEGDFLCDRCKALRRVIEDDEGILEQKRVKDILPCCLCTTYHGAMKPTTDGRWVHLTCAVWCGDLVTIKNVQQMHPVDVTRVPILAAAAQNNSVRRSLSRLRFSDGSQEQEAAVAEPSEVVVPKKCHYCQKSTGYLTTCSANGCGEVNCSIHFHPICAWFGGSFVKCRITDGTFMAQDREDKRYPAGLRFDFYCDAHAAIEGNEVTPELRPLQAQIRHTYRILESDLDHVPGSKRRKQKHKAESSSQVRSGLPLLKELPPDIYDDAICACCLKPTRELLVTEPSSSADSSNQTISCSTCGVCVHRRCVRNAAASTLPNVTPAAPVASVAVDATSAPDGSTKMPASGAAPAAMEISSVEGVAVIEGAGSSDDNQLLAPSSEVKEESAPAPAEIVSWNCDVCLSGEFFETDTIPTCGLCPRRGGLFLRTPYSRWIHSFCADFMCTVSFQESRSIGGCPNSLVSIRNIPGSKKQTCMVCNRKSGVCLKCSDPDCPVLVHPMCAEHTDKYYLRVRQGNKELYCPNHVPEYAVRIGMDSRKAHVVDILEVRNLRISLDRARVILDMILKRERLKKNLIKIQGDTFEKKLQKLCRRLRNKMVAKPSEVATENSETVPATTEEKAEVAEATGDEGAVPSAADQPVEALATAHVEVVIPDSLKELCGYAHEGGAHTMSDDEDDKDDDITNMIADDAEATPLIAPAKRGRKSKGGRGGEDVNGVDLQAEYGRGRKSKGIDRDDPSFVPFLRRSAQFDDDGETLEISMEWTKKADGFDGAVLSTSDPTLMLDVPKAFVVQYCGQDIRKEEIFAAGSLENFMKLQRQAQLDTVEKTRAVIGMFKNQEEADAFVNSLGDYIDGCMELPVEKLKSSYDKNGVIRLKPPKKAAPPVEEVPMEVVVEEIPSEPSKRRKSDTVEDSQPETGSRRRRSDASVTVASPQSKRSRLDSASSTSPSSAMDSSSVLENMKLLTTGRWGETVRRKGFEKVFEEVLAAAGGGGSAGDADWEFSNDVSDASYVTMERKCHYILQRLDGYTVKNGVEGSMSSEEYVLGLTKPSAKSGASSKKKKGSTNSNTTEPAPDNDDQRDLVEDFAVFPYDDTPEIRQELSLNGPPPSFEALRDRLKAHEIRSFADFARRFYFMLNCFRRVSPRGSKLWWDSAVLAAMFEMAKAESDVAGNAGSKLERSVSDFALVSKASAKGAGCNLKCCGCSQSYQSVSWPTASLCRECVSFEDNTFSGKQSHRKSAAVEWGWFCPDCVKKRGADLVSMDIKVWWLQDAVYYEGRVDAFDAFSGTHRIQYVDGEWEFVDLRYEPYIVHAMQFPSKQKKASSTAEPTPEPSSAKRPRLEVDLSSPSPAPTGRSSRSASSASSAPRPNTTSTNASSSSSEGSKGTLLQFFGDAKKTRSSASK